MEANIVKTLNIVNKLQQLTQSKFDFLVKSIPNIGVELEWDGDYGKYENDSHEIEFKDFFGSSKKVVGFRFLRINFR
ncbi:MAG: hypothetical protein GKR88_15305 [Flavobacteriaceae bacterium]|nr:MAG: hypothetical protein GKR88_15305 [Flavobacteriaceae bacterium]